MRTPAARGFYPSSKTALENSICDFISGFEKKECLGAIAPHAGYIYSGKTAGSVYGSIRTNKKNFVILGPNHTGYGEKISMSTDEWQTPIGAVKTDNRFMGKIPVCDDAHAFEHSIEVQLPFLQKTQNDFKIIPITLSGLSLGEIENLANKILDKDLFYIASSDFTHFGPNYGFMPIDRSDGENLDYVRKMDMKSIEYICQLKHDKFYDFVVKNKMTICGFVPITLLLCLCKKLGARRGELIKYSTSYDVMPNKSFVGYAGILLR